jgi:hypothetical protein
MEAANGGDALMNSSMKHVIEALALAAAFVGAGCSSGAMGNLSPRQLIAGGPDPAAEQKSLEQFAPVTVCPQVEVRDGTQLLRVFVKGRDGDLGAVRFQASIRKFARECHTDPSTGLTTIKVGIWGRIMTGPIGATGTTKLPIRVVAVRNGDEVLFSQLYQTDATIIPGSAAAEWTEIVDGIGIPSAKATGSFVIYVGFDESKPDPKKGKRS